MGPARKHDRPAQAELSSILAGGQLRKRSVTLAGHRTSLSVEQVFWDALKQLAAEEGTSLQSLIQRLDQARIQGAEATTSLSGAIRVYVVERLSQKLRDGARLPLPLDEPHGH